MSGLAVATIAGNIVRDAERVSDKLLTFSVAVNKYDSAAGEDKAHYYDIKVLGKRADGKLIEHLVKGRAVTVHGELVQETWEKDGNKRSAHRILVGMGGDVILMGGGDGNRAEGSTSGGRSQVSQRSNGGDKDIPF